MKAFLKTILNTGSAALYFIQVLGNQAM